MRANDVTVTHGPLAGMVFRWASATGRKVVYAAPSNGPRCRVHHVRDTKESKAEDVRVAFAKLFPANIRYCESIGYYDPKTGVKYDWYHATCKWVTK